MAILELSPEPLRPDPAALRYDEPAPSGPNETLIKLHCAPTKQIGSSILAGDCVLTKFKYENHNAVTVRSVQIDKANLLSRFLVENKNEKDGLEWLATPSVDAASEEIRRTALEFGPGSYETTLVLCNAAKSLPYGTRLNLAYATSAERKLATILEQSSEQEIRDLPKRELALLFDYFPKMMGERLAAYVQTEGSTEAQTGSKIGTAVHRNETDLVLAATAETSVAKLYDAINPEILGPTLPALSVAQELNLAKFEAAHEAHAPDALPVENRGWIREKFNFISANNKRQPKTERRSESGKMVRRGTLGLAAGVIFVASLAVPQTISGDVNRIQATAVAPERPAEAAGDNEYSNLQYWQRTAVSFGNSENSSKLVLKVRANETVWQALIDNGEPAERIMPDLSRAVEQSHGELSWVMASSGTEKYLERIDGKTDTRSVLTALKKYIRLKRSLNK